jgi:hypothetical protein
LNEFEGDRISRWQLQALDNTSTLGRITLIDHQVGLDVTLGADGSNKLKASIQKSFYNHFLPPLDWLVDGSVIFFTSD